MFGYFKRKKDYDLIKKEIMSGECYPILCSSGDMRCINLKLTYKGREVPCMGVLILNNIESFPDLEYIDGIPCIKELKKG